MEQMNVDTIQEIGFKGLSFWYDKEKPIFNEVDFTFPANEVIRITGGVAAGKSALLKILSGLVSPQEGQYLINGIAVNEMSFEEFLKYRLKIGYSFDLGGLLNNKTIWENLALPLQYHKVASEDEIEHRVERWLNLFDLKTSALLRPSAISGGKRKAAIVARAFILEPEVLLLDDPTTGLSAETKMRLAEAIRDVRRKGCLKHVFIASEDNEFFSGLSGNELKVTNLKIEKRFFNQQKVAS